MPAYYSTLFVPLDIGKNVNCFGAYRDYDLEPVVEPQQIRTNRQGFQVVTASLDALLNCGAYDRVVLGHEPTGIYHENWARALADRYQAHREGDQTPPLDYVFVNPWSSSRRRDELHRGRKRKTDPNDLKAIASCLRDGLGQPAFLVDTANLQFQLWSRAYLQNQTAKQRLSTMLLARLDRLWPGAIVNLRRFKKAHPRLEPPVPLVASRPLQRKRLRALLQHCPNPYQFRELGRAGIQEFYRTHIGRCGPVTANRAFDLVEQAILPPPAVAQLLADQLQFDFERFLALEAEADQLAQQAERLVPNSPAAVLTTVPGIGPFLAGRYLAHLGHPRRFAKPSQIWAFAGFDLVTEESGDFRRVGHITQKGEGPLRNILYLIGFNMAQNIPALARTRQKALDRGMGKIGATLHAANKANRICHHLLYHQVPFDPDRVR